MRGVRRIIGLTLLALTGCGASDSPPSAATENVSPSAAAAEASPLPPFVGQVWVSVTPGAARGSIMVFLPNKSVLQDSCFETFSIMPWGIISPNRIRWIEDTIPIEAEWTQPTAQELILKPIGGASQQTYVTASVPYLCPDRAR